MPNRKKTATKVHVPEIAPLSHETAQNHHYFSLPLKGTKEKKLAELSLFMRLQVSFLIHAIESDIADSENDEVTAAVYLYREAKLLHHYIKNDIK